MSEQTSVIHDIGYQRYAGPRLGRTYAVRSLYEHSLRTAFGVGRGMKSKIFPWGVVGVASLITVIIAAVSSTAGQRVISYVNLVDQMSVLIIIFLAVAAPELISRDLRAKVLPLYFARPVGRFDYVGAKFAALVTATWMAVGLPMVIVFAAVAFDVDRIGDAWKEFTLLLGGLVYVLVLVLINAAVSMLVAACTGRRAFAAGGIVGIYLVTLPVSLVLSEIGGGAVRNLSGLPSPTMTGSGLRYWVTGDGPIDIGGYGWVYLVASLVLVAGSVAVTHARYRRVDS
jgi:ABC-2 type transport system permease protein